MIRTKDTLKFPEFDDIKVSTKTYTATTNLNIEIKDLYDKLPITPYTVITKKRGRKKKTDNIDPNTDIEEGSIITIKFEGQIRGVELKPKKQKQTNKQKWFRNSITIVIIFDKPINFKICKNGTFQMTGCKTHEHAELCIKYIWKYIKNDDSLYSFSSGNSIECIFIPSMRNIDFSLGFIVDREKLNKYMSEQQKFHCLLETSFGYTGVNIKIPINHDITKMPVKKINANPDSEDWVEKWTIYQEYLNNLSEKEQLNKINTPRYNTFLVFHSGKCISSCLTAEFMKDTYYYFLNIIRECYDQIEERLDERIIE